MKHTLFLILLASLLFSACVPAPAEKIVITNTPVPTVVPLPSNTFSSTETSLPTNTVTPTATPTATPTPIPTIQVGDLIVPDPRYSNPEFFYTERELISGGESYDSPIVQFVNAMEMAGVIISPEEVRDCLLLQKIKDINGNTVFIAEYEGTPLFQYADGF